MSNIRLSPRHGVNPTLTCCFFCGKESGVALLGHLPDFKARKNLGEDIAKTLSGPVDDREAPRRLILDREPCDECKGWMEQGIILISVDEAKTVDRQNPYRTGGFVVLKEEAVRKIFSPPELVENICKTRMAYMPDETWDKLGLPRVEKSS